MNVIRANYRAQLNEAMGWQYADSGASVGLRSTCLFLWSCLFPSLYRRRSLSFSVSSLGSGNQKNPSIRNYWTGGDGKAFGFQIGFLEQPWKWLLGCSSGNQVFLQLGLRRVHVEWCWCTRPVVWRSLLRPCIVLLEEGMGGRDPWVALDRGRGEY